MRTKVLIVGLGQLGRDLVKALQADFEVRGVDIPELDITKRESVESIMNEFAPDIVINSAAYTDVEGAEDDREQAFAVNRDGAAIIAEAAASRDIPVVLYSTDFVFDGRKGDTYRPDDETNPLSVYGASKLAGEQATIAANPRHFILRTAWLYGPGGNNFVEKIIARATVSNSLKVVTDEVGSPTYTWDVATITGKLIQTENYGVYHVVNEGVCSRYELAAAVIDSMRIAVEMNECLSSDFPTKATRPEYSVLDCSTLTDVCGIKMPAWRDALERYLERRNAPGN